MRSLADLFDEFYLEIGTDLAELVEDVEVARWLNAGQRRLGFKRDLESALTWTAGDTEVALPTGVWQVNRLVANSDTLIPAYQIRETTIRFLVDEDGVSDDGGATLLYQGNYPQITDSQDSLLSDDGDDALVAFALYRFFRKLATTRSLYTRYSTLTGQNAVTVDDLLQIASQHLDEFLAVRDDVPLSSPTTFFGE